jgi:thiol-disulfide isomerase/thioredoxin
MRRDCNDPRETRNPESFTGIRSGIEFFGVVAGWLHFGKSPDSVAKRFNLSQTSRIDEKTCRRIQRLVKGVTVVDAKLFGRIRRCAVALAMLSLVACAGTACGGSAVLVSFSSPHCGACEAMERTISELERGGVPIRHVDVSREPEFAARFGIRHTPTFVVWSGGKELTRLVGVQSAEALRKAIAINPSGTLFQTNASVGQADFSAAAKTRLSGAARPAGTTRGEAMPDVSMAQAIERAQAATVRLRVHDGRGFGVGTGTIIDRHGEEALVMTCGHLFRETKHEAKIDVDLFVAGEIKTVPGQVVDYDADDRDIALVVIRPGFDIQPVQVLPASRKPQSGEAVFSFGCDHGDDPSRRDTRITGIDKYNQHKGMSNIEIAGAPVDGRSGGGLFDSQGRLIGVCNAADYKGDVGIYTGPGSIQWQLDRVSLSHLYQADGSALASQPTTGQSAAPSSVAADVPAAPQTRLASLGQAASLPPGSQSAVSSSGQEVIVIVRDAGRPDHSRVITLNQPSPELMQMIDRHAVRR